MSPTPEHVRVVRRFHRTVTSVVVGALDERYLGRSRPLGAARVLWEVGDGATEVRALRRRLGLDAGYVSRLVTGLAAEGLIEISVACDDRRVRTITLTPAGVRERTLLDRRSDELARALLSTLPPRQRDRLVTAMRDVDRLLTSGLVTIDVVDPASPAAATCIKAYVAELNTRFDAGFDPTISIPADAAALRAPYGRFVIASLRGSPVGCGALKIHTAGPAEIKRMWVDRSVRGHGVGRRILEHLETAAREAGTTVVRLETNRVLCEAVALYRSAGFNEVAAFNDEPYAHHWFEKVLKPRP